MESQEKKYKRYSKILLRLLKKGYIYIKDPEDIAQEVLIEVLALPPSREFDPQKGKEETWLKMLLRGTISHAARKKQTARRTPPNPHSPPPAIIDNYENAIIELLDHNQEE